MILSLALQLNDPLVLLAGTRKSLNFTLQLHDCFSFVWFVAICSHASVRFDPVPLFMNTVYLIIMSSYCVLLLPTVDLIGHA